MGNQVAHIMEGDRLPILAVVLEAGDGTDAVKQARAATDYATASSAVFLFTKRGESTTYSYAGTVTLVASTTLTISLAWAGTEAPLLSTGSGRWDFTIRVTLASGKTAAFPTQGAFRLDVSNRVAAT